jgi:two-component system OmpR family response regulator
MLCRADGSPIKVLVGDDERLVAEMISMALRYEGAEVIMAGDGARTLSAAQGAHVDVAIVNSALPDMDGARCLRMLCQQHPGLLVLLLSAVPGGPDRVTRAAAGEHWLAKPFSLEELLLKVRVMLRRSGVPLRGNDVEMVVDDLVLNEDTREVTRDGQPVRLTYTEFELLRFFMRNAHRVVTKSEILRRVWPYDFAGRPSVVELYISYLRKKIDVDRTPLIHTLRRTGYILKYAAP